MAYGKRTGAKPITVEGITFHCYHIGILLTRWESEDHTLWAQRNHRGSGYTSRGGIVGQPEVGNRFRSLENAMRAAVKAQRKARP